MKIQTSLAVASAFASRIAAVAAISLLIFLFFFARSALKHTVDSDRMDRFGDRSQTPYLTLMSVEIRARHHGRETVRFDCDKMALEHSLRSLSINGIHDGIISVDSAHHLTFQATDANIQSNYGAITSGRLTIDGQIFAQIIYPLLPITFQARALSFDWSTEIAESKSAVQFTVPKLGIASASGFSINLKTHSVDFNGVEARSSMHQLLKLADKVTKSESQHAESNSADDSVTMSAPDGGHYDEKSDVLTLRGPVTFHQQEITVETVGGLYDHKTNTAKSLNPVKLYDKQNTLTGSKGTVDFGKHIAMLTGEIVLKANPQRDTNASKSSIDQEAHKPTQLSCDRITYNYRTKLANIDGNIVITQTTRTVTGDTGKYDANTQIAELIGNIDGKDTDGKHLRAPKATLSLKEGDEWIEVPGPIQYEFKIKNEDNPRPSQNSSTAQQPKPSP